MNRGDLPDLWTRLAAGEPLSAEERARLEDALRTDPSARKEFLDDAEIDALLQARVRIEADADAFAAAFANRLKAEREATRFIEKVESRLARRPPARRAVDRGTGGNPSWGPLLVAAALLFGILLLYSLRSSETPSSEHSARRAPSHEEEGPRAIPEPPPPPPPPDRSPAPKIVESAPPKVPARPDPVREEKTPPAPPPEPAKGSKPPQTTVVMVAKLEHIVGDVVLVDPSGRSPAKSRSAVSAGQGVETGPNASVVLKYEDGTRVDVGGETTIGDFALEGGKRLFLRRGAVRMQVAKQPKDQPMVLVTPHSRANVLGTTLRLYADPDPRKGTHLDVDEGKVELRNLSDQAVLVEGGHYAVAATGVELVTRPLARLMVTVDRNCPVIYSNNGTLDCYADEYLMGLASLGEIHLRGIITTSAVPDSFDALVAERADVVGQARRSGMKNIPDPIVGNRGLLARPRSAVVEDTVGVGSPGSRLIAAEARKATASRPLVIVSGGPLTPVAEAYLSDKSIADKVVVLSHQGLSDDTLGGDDPWASYIVMERMRLVLFGAVYQSASVSVPRARVQALPEVDLKRALAETAKRTLFDTNGLGGIAMMRPDYCVEAKRKSFSGWQGRGQPTLKDDPNGRVIVVTRADRDVGTEEFWRVLEKPETWSRK